MLTRTQLLEWTDEPHLRISDEALAALNAYNPNEAALEVFRDGFYAGSRKGLVLTYVAGHLRHGTDFPHRILAFLASLVWTEGKLQSAIEEFGLDEEFDIDCYEMVYQMQPFAQSSVVMSDDDRAAFDALPDPFTVWRGGAGGREVIKNGFSWTYDRAVATDFAQRREPPGEIAWRRIRKVDVIACFTDRQESEVVVWPAACRRPSPAVLALRGF